VQGGILPDGDWAGLERDWMRPARDGACLPDFTLEGPLDLFFSPTAQPQLWLPHPAEAGRLRRVLLRRGAALTVRGARSAALRRAVGLPPVSLAVFVRLATEDRDKAQAAGLFHLAAGLRERAEAAWNGTAGNATTPALVGIQLALAEGVGALMAAPGEDGGLRRLRARQLAEGVLELAPRGDSLPPAGAKALALTAAPYAWPLRSAAPQTLRSYEHLLREVLASQVFAAGAAGEQGGGPRPAPDVPLQLRKSAAQAVLLLRMEVEVERSPAALGTDAAGAAAAASTPSVPEIIVRQAAGGGARGGRETWAVVAKVTGSAGSGLRLEPVRVEAVRVERESATFAADALLLGLLGNVREVGLLIGGSQRGCTWARVSRRSRFFFLLARGMSS
jgi:hypothetical protein